MLSWYAAVGYGAVGGLIVEAVMFWGRLRAWQEARHLALASNGARPTLREFIDPWPDLAVATTRALLGCVVGFVLHGELTGAYAAVAVGASAPALLTQFGGKAVTNVDPDGKPGPGRMVGLDAVPPFTGDALTGCQELAE